MEVLSLGETMPSPGTIEYLTKAPVPDRETSIGLLVSGVEGTFKLP